MELFGEYGSGVSQVRIVDIEEDEEAEHRVFSDLDIQVRRVHNKNIGHGLN
jgi:hypothetical protein